MRVPTFSLFHFLCVYRRTLSLQRRHSVLQGFFFNRKAKNTKSYMKRGCRCDLPKECRMTFLKSYRIDIMFLEWKKSEVLLTWWKTTLFLISLSFSSSFYHPLNYACFVKFSICSILETRCFQMPKSTLKGENYS